MRLWAFFMAASVQACSLAAADAPGPHANPDDQFRGVWYVQQVAAPAFFSLGFNAVLVPLQGFSIGKDILKPSLAETRRRWLDLVEAHDADYFESLGNVPRDPEMLCRYPQLRKNGKPGRQPEMISERAQMDARAWVERIAATVPTNRPCFAGMMPTSEVRDKSFPTTSDAFRAAWSAASDGRSLPDHQNSRVAPHYDTLKDFPVSRIVDEDDAMFAFYRWYWKDGDGWNRYCTEAVKAYERALGRPLFTFYDPAVRVPPFWGSGGEVSHLNHWTYVYPEPFNISFVTACTTAMARGRPGQRVMGMAQGISYRSALAPIGLEPSGITPEWVRRLPNAIYISTPPDMMREALWTLFSHRLDGIFTHGWQSILDAREYGMKPSSYAYANAETKLAISNVFHTAGLPLGPLFKALPETGDDVAIIESSAAWIFARTGGWGNGGSKYNVVGTLATLANLSPRVLYDEEIARDGIPATTKVLLMPNCEVVTRKTFEAVRMFQAKGGAVIGDANLSPRILPDALVPAYERTRKAATDVPAFRKAAADLKAIVSEYLDLAADSNRDDIFVRLRRLSAADYLFAINDRRGPGDYVGPWGLVWEKGLPNAGTVCVNRPGGAVYDLVRHVPVPFTVRNGKTFVDVEYTTNDGKVLLVTDRPLAPLKVESDGKGVVAVASGDAGLMIPIEIVRAGKKPFYGVVVNGRWYHDFGTTEKVCVRNLATGETFEPQ